MIKLYYFNHYEQSNFLIILNELSEVDIIEVQEMLVVRLVDQVPVTSDSLYFVRVVVVQNACVVLHIVLVEKVEAFENMDLVLFLLQYRADVSIVGEGLEEVLLL